MVKLFAIYVSRVVKNLWRILMFKGEVKMIITEETLRDWIEEKLKHVMEVDVDVARVNQTYAGIEIVFEERRYVVAVVADAEMDDSKTDTSL